LPLGEVKIDIVTSSGRRGSDMQRSNGRAGPREMEALTGVTVALLTIYDMCKAVDEEMQIFDVRLIEKEKHNV